MNVRDHVDQLFGALLAIVGPYGLLVLSTAGLLTLALMLGLMLNRRISDNGDDSIRRADRPDALAPRDLLDASPESQHLIPAPGDGIITLGRTGFFVLVIAVTLFCWGAGFALAKDSVAFLSSKEWQFQPFYIAAHLVTLRLFVAFFTRNYRAGIERLNVPPELALAGMHRILGARGALSAFLVALPFCIADFRYLHGPRYEKLDAAAPLLPIDYLMWCIWSAEWFLNAFIWVILVGFLLRNVRTLRQYQFLAPIEVVLQDKHYRPFLRMSSQGAGVVLGFGIMTVLYISYTGGAVTDYLGLGVTGTLLVIGFVVPWILLRRKVREAVESEHQRLREGLRKNALAAVDGAAVGADDAREQELRHLVNRLDYVVSLLRTSHLERLHLNLGATEARAVAFRLLAPAATIAWQLAQNHKPLMEQIGRIVKPIIARIGN